MGQLEIATGNFPELSVLHHQGVSAELVCLEDSKDIGVEFLIYNPECGVVLIDIVRTLSPSMLKCEVSLPAGDHAVTESGELAFDILFLGIDIDIAFAFGLPDSERLKAVVRVCTPIGPFELT